MNYTENYHLPQWDEDDRILRKDFNSAMAQLEEGLTGNRSAAAGANQSAAACAESRAFDRICRLAYNHYCAAQTVKAFPRQIGVFHQDTSVSGEGLEGMSKFEGYYQVSNGASFDENSLFSMFEQQGPMTSTFIGGTSQMTITFTAPGNGSIDKLTVQTTCQHDVSITFTCDLTFQDLTTGKVIKTAKLPWVIPQYVTSYSFVIEENLCFHTGHQYRITVRPRAVQADTSSTVIRAGMKVTCQTTGGEGTATHVFHSPDENLGLLAVASYRLAGGEEPKLLFNGEEISARWVRDIADGTGKTIRESVFRRNVPVEDGDTVKLQFFCPPGGEATFYSWGTVLL